MLGNINTWGGYWGTNPYLSCKACGQKSTTVSTGPPRSIIGRFWRTNTKLLLESFLTARLIYDIVQDHSVAQLYVSVGISLIFRKHLHDIISLRVEVWEHKTSLTLILFIEDPVQIQESEQSWICVVGVHIFPLSTIFLLDFGNVPTSVVFFCFTF